MRFCKDHILILLLFWAGYLPAQTNNLWPAYESNKTYKQSAYYFDENGNFKFIPHLTNAPIDTLKHEHYTNIYTASNWSGSTALYSDNFDFFVNGVRIGNSKVYIPESDDYSFRESYSRPIIAPCDTVNFMFIRSFTKVEGLHDILNEGSGFVSYAYIKKDLSHTSSYSIPFGASNKRIEYPNESVLGCGTTRNYKGQLVLVVRTTNNLYSYEWNPIKLRFVSLDSIHVPFLTLSSNPLYSDKSLYTVDRLSWHMGPVVSSKGDKVAFSINYDVTTATGRKVVEIVSTILQFDFDRNTGSFTKLMNRGKAAFVMIYRNG